MTLSERLKKVREWPGDLKWATTEALSEVSNEDKAEMKKAGWGLAWLVSVPLQSVYESWVISRLWEWHVSRTFGTPRITWKQALGLNLLASVVVQKTSVDSNDDPDLAKSTVAMWLTPTAALMLGWLCRTRTDGD